MNNKTLGVTSGKISFIFDRPIICKTVKYIDQSDKKSSSRLIPDWSLENMTSNMAQNRMLLDFSCKTKKKKNNKKRYNKHDGHLILIKLIKNVYYLPN